MPKASDNQKQPPKKTAKCSSKGNNASTPSANHGKDKKNSKEKDGNGKKEHPVQETVPLMPLDTEQGQALYAQFLKAMASNKSPVVQSLTDTHSPGNVGFSTPTSTSLVTQESPTLVSLSSLGLKPVHKEMSSFSTKQKANYLKCTYCTSDNSIFSIIFRSQPSTPGFTWPEKVIEDATKEDGSWASEPNGLCIDKHIGRWFDNDVAQMNIDKRGNPYGVRLYYLHTKKKPTEKIMKSIGNVICCNVNQTPGNSTKLLLDESNYFWLPQPVAWADVVGNKEAYEMVLKDVGTPVPGKEEILVFLII